MIDIIQKRTKKLFSLVSSQQISFDDNLYETLPTTGGIYRVFEKDSTWKESLYIGQTGNLRSTIYKTLLIGDSTYHTLRDNLNLESKFPNEKKAFEKYLRDNARVQYLEIADKDQRTLVEYFVISVLDPEYND